jgi:DNA-binding transcriptional LysR family regulator
MHEMHERHLIELDLNLLVALRALLLERHVTRAAARIGLTQPAMSHALGRLRTQLSDPLLVRTASGMQLTPRASELAPSLDRVLEDLSKLLVKPEAFDPARSTHTFRIATSDYVELVLLPKLLERLWRLAPNVNVRLKNLAKRGLEDLDEGVVDFVLGPSLRAGGSRGGREPRGFFGQKVISERFVCVVREDHPAVGKRLTLETFLDLPHALVTPRGDLRGIVDTALAKLGRRRRIAIDVPHFLVAPFFVERTDLVLTVAERVARALSSSIRLKILPPPSELNLPGFDIALYWHERHRADPAHVWLRSLIASVAKTL